MGTGARTLQSDALLHARGVFAFLPSATSYLFGMGGLTHIYCHCERRRDSRIRSETDIPSVSAASWTRVPSESGIWQVNVVMLPL